MAEKQEPWLLDKRLPLVLLLTQTLTVVWFASKLDSRTEANTAEIVYLTSTTDNLRTMFSSLIDRTTRLEVDTGNYRNQLTNRLDAIERKLDVVVEQMRQRADLRAPTRSTIGEAKNGHLVE